MSEEEKQAIKIVNDYLLYSEINRTESDVAYELVQLKIPKAMRKVLELLEKQQKEIEMYIKVFKDLNNNWISKDKIREKIEFYKRYGKIKNSNEYVMSVEIEVLEELLEEGE